MGAYEGPNRHEEMQRANDLVQELNACDVANPMTESALKAIGPARSTATPSLRLGLPCVRSSLTAVRVMFSYQRCCKRSRHRLTRVDLMQQINDIYVENRCGLYRHRAAFPCCRDRCNL